MKYPKDEIKYGIICEKSPEPHAYFETFEAAFRCAKSEQPSYRPYYIVECVEHYKICGCVDDKEEDKSRVNETTDCIAMVVNESSVTPQPKVGHWIKYGSPMLGEQHYKCTLCGYYINFSHWGELYTKEFKYCPNCGSKMLGEEPQESEEK